MMQKLAENVWLFSHPLKILGADIRRNVTVIRLSNGRLVIHSTAKFSAEEIGEIRSLGEPGWLVEGMLDHDTFSGEGRRAFPEIPFLAPEGFAKRVPFEIAPLAAPPSEWHTELEVIPIEGAPKMKECALFHHPSGTLVVCDLLFHFPEIPSLWAKLLFLPTLGLNPAPAFSKRLKISIDDKDAFRKSLEKVLSLPIQRIVPGHGVVLEENAHEKARRAFEDEGLL